MIMIIQKELDQISWQVTEKQYRADPALSYSTLSRYEREGFNNLDKLFEHISTPSLTLGSIVDTLITGSVEEFESNFFVTDMPLLGEKESQVANDLFDSYHEQYASLAEIPKELVLEAANKVSFQKNWRDDTRVRVLSERISDYYSLRFHTENKTIVSRDTYYKAMAMVRALKESPATHAYFADNDEMSPVRRYYQLKFKARLQGVDYRSMAD